MRGGPAESRKGDGKGGIEVLGTEDDKGGADGGKVEIDEKPDVEASEEPVIEEFHAEDEVEPLRALPTPCTPSAEEVALHRALGHVQFRPWCDYSVEGRGRELGHYRAESKGRVVPVVAFDYLFISKAGIFSRADGAMQPDQIGQKVLLVREIPGDGKRHSVFAHVVPQKGRG